MERKVYTIRRYENQNLFIVVSRKDFVRDLAENVCCDFDVVGGWCGISSANYTKGENEARKLAKKNCGGLLADKVGIYRVFQSWEDFMSHINHFKHSYEDRRKG